MKHINKNTFWLIVGIFTVAVIVTTLFLILEIDYKSITYCYKKISSLKIIFNSFFYFAVYIASLFILVLQIYLIYKIIFIFYPVIKLFRNSTIKIHSEQSIFYPAIIFYTFTVIAGLYVRTWYPDSVITLDETGTQILNIGQWIIAQGLILLEVVVLPTAEDLNFIFETNAYNILNHNPDLYRFFVEEEHSYLELVYKFRELFPNLEVKIRILNGDDITNLHSAKENMDEIIKMENLEKSLGLEIEL